MVTIATEDTVLEEVSRARQPRQARGAHAEEVHVHDGDRPASQKESVKKYMLTRTASRPVKARAGNFASTSAHAEYQYNSAPVNPCQLALKRINATMEFKRAAVLCFTFTGGAALQPAMTPPPARASRLGGRRHALIVLPERAQRGAQLNPATARRRVRVRSCHFDV